jgi:iron complex transport system substrate-binding protein
MDKQLRIVSLIASATEIVCALGLRDEMVGRSHECDYPESINVLPQCTSPKFKLDGSSYDIDQRVKAVLQESLSVYKVDATLLESLAPTHIITQSQCEVCAVSLRDVEEAACQFISSQPQIISLEPNSLGDIWTDIRTVGGALGVQDIAEKLISQLKTRLSVIEAGRKRTDIGTLSKAKPKPTVAFIEWVDPLMTGGNWMPELIDIAGGINLFGEPGKHSPPLAWDAIRAADPDVIVIAPCGFDIPRTLEETAVLTGKTGWDELSCVRNGRVFVADGNQYFNRPGPRLVDSAEILADAIAGRQSHRLVPVVATKTAL